MSRIQIPSHAAPAPAPDAIGVALDDLENQLPELIAAEAPAAASWGTMLELALPSLLLAGERALAQRALSALVDLANITWVTTERRGAVQVAFDGKRYAVQAGPVHHVCTTSLWIASVFRALLAHRKDGVDAALAFPEELLDAASSLTGDAYKKEMARALRSFLGATPALAGDHIARARELTSAALATVGGPRRARCAREQLGMLSAIARRDQDAFDRAAADALVAHHALASRGRARHQPDAYFDWPVLGLAALAVDRGLAWRIDSAYAPSALVEGGAS